MCNWGASDVFAKLKMAAFGPLTIVWLATGAQTALSAEGASSNYFPGTYGSLLVAVAPEPGGVFSNLTIFYGADADRSALQGRVNTNLEVSAVYDYLQGFYVWEVPEIGGRFMAGGYLPLGYAGLNASITAGGVTRGISGNEFALGDIGIIPGSFFWSAGNFHFNAYEMVIAPTGQYNLGNAVNIGRNYWSFDTVAAVTWFNPNSGTEISLVPGLMINTENPDTNYRTGAEFHLDVVFSQFLTEKFAVGPQGYYYKQITGDSGSGAVLGDFKGESFGLGIGASYVPEIGGRDVVISAKWIHDFDTTNKIEGDYGALQVSFQF